ncbi:MAG: NADH-quinone oxidoreductase subunit J, partial [Nitrospinota bacterium]
MAGLIFFYFLAFLTVAGAVAVVALPNPLYSVLSLVVTFLGLAGLYLSLNAQFIAVVQVIVYAGAVMMLFLFVVMLINLGREERQPLRLPIQKLVGTIIGLGIFVGLVNLYVAT